MNSSHRAFWRPTFLVCLVGIAASLVPAVMYTDPFWGIRSFMDKEPFGATDAPGVIVLQVDSDSPAAALGIREHDRIVRIDKTPAEFADFRNQLARIPPRQPVTIDVIRSETELHLSGPGTSARLEGVLFLDWQFIAAPVFLVLIMLLIATEPLEPPLWRAIVVATGGLAVITATVLTETMQAIPWTIVWQTKPISHSFPRTLHRGLALTALLSALALCMLGSLGVRAVLLARKKARA